jgi:uncharacterized protein YjbJ (UPF0337 family)
MDHDQVSGTAKNLGGNVEESLGCAIGDAETQAHGQMTQVEESVQDLYGQAKDSAADAAAAVRKMPASAEDTVRHYIENRPYTAVAIALALGWLLGRTHRPF